MCQRGLNWRKMRSSVVQMLQGCLPDIMYVQVAGNDLDLTEPVETIVHKYMFQACTWVDSLALRRVILSMALPRSNARSMSARQYNQRVRQFNRLLSQPVCSPYPRALGRVTRGRFMVYIWRLPPSSGCTSA